MAEWIEGCVGTQMDGQTDKQTVHTCVKMVAVSFFFQALYVLGFCVTDIDSTGTRRYMLLVLFLEHKSSRESANTRADICTVLCFPD